MSEIDNVQQFEGDVAEWPHHAPAWFKSWNEQVFEHHTARVNDALRLIFDVIEQHMASTQEERRP